MSMKAYKCPSGCCAVDLEARGFGGRPVTVNGHHFQTMDHVAAEYEMSRDTLQYRVRKGQCLMAPVKVKEGVERRTRPVVNITLFNDFLRKARPPRVSSDAAMIGAAVSKEGR